MARPAHGDVVPKIFSSKPYVESGFGVDHLTNNQSKWSHQYIDLMLPMREKGLIYFQALRASRYLENDGSVFLSYSYPTSLGVISLDTTYSENPTFLIKRGYGTTWTGYGIYGFNYLLGLKNNQYVDSRTDSQVLGLESYLGSWRFAYLANHSQLNHSKSGWVNKYQIQYFGESTRLGVTYARGSEPTLISPGNMMNADIETYQIDGAYPISSSVSITSMIWHSKQGYFYLRNGIQFGIRYTY